MEHGIAIMAAVVFSLAACGSDNHTQEQDAATRMDHRIADALSSVNAGSVEEKLKHVPEGTPGQEKVVAHLSELKRRNAATHSKDLKKQARSVVANRIVARRGYVGALRERFLDEGMDIKVSVSGKSATQLNLKYALFNDVWVHKFRKGSLANEVSGMGFKKVDFDNGYDYHVGLTFE